MKTFISALCVLFSSVLFANILEVPNDFDTIQEGIEAANDGDTVLVAPGEYQENINFLEKSIFFASQYILQREEHLIRQTIIDGGGNGNVVKLDECPETAVLVGFTIMNGFYRYGGGIQVGSSHFALSNLIISNNNSSSCGGGLYIMESEGILTNVDIAENTVDGEGGGLFIHNSSLELSDVIINANFSEGDGGGLYCSGDNIFEIQNVIIDNNESERTGGGISIRHSREIQTYQNLRVTNNHGNRYGGGIAVRCSNEGIPVFNHITMAGNSPDAFYIDSDHLLELKNSILYGNGFHQIKISGDVEIDIDYCDIHNGQENIEVVRGEPEINWGDGNLDADPRFTDNYHLRADSPCINTGDPEDDRDPDGTITDMGFYPFMDWAILTGSVRDALNAEPLFDGLIYTSFGDSCFSDENGEWELDPCRSGVFNLYCEYEGYNDVIIEDFELEVGDDVHLDIEMTKPEIIINPLELEFDVDLGDERQTTLLFENTGNGQLEWSVDTRVLNPRPWDRWEITDIPLGNVGWYATGGLFYWDGLFYVHYLSFVPLNNYLYQFNNDGEVIGHVHLPLHIVQNTSFTDLCTDGEHIWGFVRNSFYTLDMNGRVLDRIEIDDYSRNYGITWDPNRQLIWVVLKISDDGPDRFVLAGLNEFLEIQVETDIESCDDYYLSYWHDDPDGKQLYMLREYDDGEMQAQLVKYDLNTFDYDIVHDFEDVVCGDIEVVAGYDPGRIMLAMVNLIDNVEQRSIRLMQYDYYPHWFAVTPAAGIIQPESEFEIQLGFNTEHCEINTEYSFILGVNHNAVGGRIEIPVSMTVIDPDAVRETSNYPFSFEIASIYPNPFNSTTAISYTLPYPMNIELSVYDLRGRKLQVLTRGTKPAGAHTLHWNASELPAGSYLVRMGTSGGSMKDVKKVVLVK